MVEHPPGQRLLSKAAAALIVTIARSLSSGCFYFWSAMGRECHYCGEWKSDDEFRRKNGRQCKACARAAGRKWRRENPEKRRAAGRKWRRKRTRKNWSTVRSLYGPNCHRCGYGESHTALTFHHINPAEKLKTGRGAVRQLDFEELNKCILLCSNCHMEFTAGVWGAIFRKRANGYGYEIERLTQGN